MAEKVSLVDQIAAVDSAVSLLESDFRDANFYREYTEALNQKILALNYAAKSLRFLLVHEQTIRDAISSARTVDDTQDTR